MPPPNPRKKKSGGDPSVRRRKQVERKHSDKERPEPSAPEAFGDEPVRLNRFLARSGVASRRESDKIISAGRVSINGDIVTELGTKVQPGDRVKLDGRSVGATGLVYILLNKPGNTITTKSDERDRRTVMDLIDIPPEESSALFPVGRLDRPTTGALLLTTDGDLAHRLMHPSYEVQKIYLCTTSQPMQEADLDKLRAGVELDDGKAAADEAQFLGGDKTRLAIQIHEGRNRQVRRMVEAIGYSVEKLDRVAYAGLNLEGLRRGKWRRLKPHEINRLRRVVNLKAVVQ